MEKGILHLHLTVIVIFLLSFCFKAFLLFKGDIVLLDKVRNKTKILEMIFGTLILLTGGYLLYVTKNNQAYMIVKLFLVVAAIPLGIIGLKKSNKLFTSISLVLFIYIFALAWTRDLGLNIGRSVPSTTQVESTGQLDSIPLSNTESKPEEPVILQENEAVSIENSKVLYNKLCVQCHGPSGNLGAGGAKDLTASTLTDAQKEEIISNGKGLMAPFKYTLSEQEIKQLVQYVDTFKK